MIDKQRVSLLSIGTESTIDYVLLSQYFEALSIGKCSFKYA